MPRKRNSPRFPKHTTPVHPSLSSSSSASRGHHHIPRSLHSASTTTGNLVNDLIQRQRLSSASPTPKVTEPSLSRAGSVQAQTLPPSLNAILQGPDHPFIMDPGLTYHMVRRSTRTVGRAPAGPPPPNSWLQQGNHVSREQDSSAEDEDENEDDFILEKSEGDPPIDPLPGLSVPDKGSLQYQTLKSLALRWDWHLEHEGDNLAALPMKLKERILYFVANFNHGMMTRAGLEVLFSGDSGPEDLAVTENLTHLDLGTSIGSGCSLDDLIKIFVHKTHHVSAFKQEDKNLIIPDAWDAPEAVSIMHHQLPSFSFLTHLSLAHPFKACWISLLRLAPHLATLTHLSLAYWPPPSFREVKNDQHRSVPFLFQQKLIGNGLNEAPKILRRLSRATYCLQWLDLTGCCGWLWALQCTDGPDWAGSWRRVQMVKAGLDQAPRFDIKSGVNYFIDFDKPIKKNQGPSGQRDWFELSDWVWYVRSLRKMEALVNQLRTGPPTPRVRGEGAPRFETQMNNPDFFELMTVRLSARDRGTSTSTAPDYKWWHDPNQGRFGLELKHRSERCRTDGRVAFETSSDERALLAELVEAFHLRGSRIEFVNFTKG